MEKELLERCLDQGMSLSEIGVLVDKDHTTVGYWVKKHGLKAANQGKFAPRGGIAEEVLELLMDEGASLHEMAEELDRSVSTVRYWLNVYGFGTTRGGRRRKEVAAARAAGVKRLRRECPRHGLTEYTLQRRGRYICNKCRSEAVARRRRKVKEILVKDAGGRCQLCGYDKSTVALHFHHVDPGSKAFGIAANGSTRGIAELRVEAAKCILLCANCHAEVEAGITVLPESIEADTVNGGLPTK